jgi:hypothetical protein
MSYVVEAVTNLLSGEAMTQLSTTVGAGPNSVGKAIAAAVPALINGMADKAKQAGGANALLGLLNSDANRASGVSDGSLLGNVSALLSNPSAFGGIEMLQSLFGTGLPNVEQKVSRVSGLPVGTTGRLLPVLAPILMGLLGKQVTAKGLDAAGMTRFLSDQQGFLRASAPGLIGFLEKIAANDDGSIVDDLHRLFGRLTGHQA